MPNYTVNTAPSDYDGDGPRPFTLIPDDTTLEAKVAKIEEEVKPFKDDAGNPVVKLVWTFTTNYDNQDRKVWGETGVEFFAHPDCKFYAWTQESLGAELPTGFSIDTDDLLGKDVRVVMGVRSYTPKDAEVDPETGAKKKKHVNFVRDVIRPRAAMSGASTAPALDATNEPF